MARQPAPSRALKAPRRPSSAASPAAARRAAEIGQREIAVPQGAGETLELGQRDAAQAAGPGVGRRIELWTLAKEGEVGWTAQDWKDKGAVEVAVEPLAGTLGQEEAAMARGTLEPALRVVFVG